MTVRLIRVSVMLYAISFAHISCLMYSGLYAWKLLKPMVYFSLRKEPSIRYTNFRISHIMRTLLLYELFAIVAAFSQNVVKKVRIKS